MTTDLILPIVNINGTSPDVLLQQQRDVRDAAKVLYKALVDASPHGRDYQLHPDHQQACTNAIRAHNERLFVVARIQNDADKVIANLLLQTGRKWWDEPG